jgi:hypothetical protein
MKTMTDRPRTFHIGTVEEIETGSNDEPVTLHIDGEPFHRANENVFEQFENASVGDTVKIEYWVNDNDLRLVTALEQVDETTERTEDVNDHIEKFAGEIRDQKSRFCVEATTRLFKVWDDRYKHFHYDENLKAGSMEIMNEHVDMEDIHEVIQVFEDEFDVIAHATNMLEEPIVGYVINERLNAEEDDE